MAEGLMVEESESDVGDERRDEDRVDVDFEVRVQAPVRADGRALELSESGVRVELRDDVTDAMHVSIQFDLPTLADPVGLLADIRWHEQVGSKADPRWICGLRFADVEPDVEAAIATYLAAMRAEDGD